MAKLILILGESGTGKTQSLKKLDPNKTLLIQSINKALTFISASEWTQWNQETNPKGNVFVNDHPNTIVDLIKRTTRKIIVIDDFQYISSNEMFRRHKETQFTKWNEMAFNGWNIIQAASNLSDDVRVYFISHVMLSETGVVKIKTPGKLLEGDSVEGRFPIVFRTFVNGLAENKKEKYFFRTQNDGKDTVKTPEDMFLDDLIPNDLSLIDKRICEYYKITEG